MTELKDWKSLPIKEFIDNSIPGEWGTEGTPDNGIPVLRSTNFINDGSIDYSDIAYRKVPINSLKKRLVKNGTLLVEKAGGKLLHI